MASSSSSTNSMLFREYIGAMWKEIKFTDVPINPNVDFHFILSFAIDYNTDSSPPKPSNGIFNIFWDHYNLGPSQVSSIKKVHPNVKVALSLGGDTVKEKHVFFDPTSIDSWVKNAVSSLTKIIKKYSLDGIDINYEHFKDGTDNPGIFAECIGRLVKVLKQKKVISFASIAPFNDALVQRNYMALWKNYAQVIDYVNFQFYAYDKGTTVSKFLEYYREQTKNYNGGKVIPSFLSNGSGGLSPEGDGFFTACRELRGQGQLHGIFMWCADDSKEDGFPYEEKSQAMLASQETTVNSPSSTSSKLFREYIGATWNEVKFTDVPINDNVDFHFILSFAIDSTDSSPHSATDGNFNIFWNSDDLGPSQVTSIKKKYQNVKVALSLGGDTVGEKEKAYFNPTSIDSWVKNAVSTLTKIIKQYSLDGIDINYQHFKAGADPHIFAECVGRLLKALKKSKVISFASIAPFDDDHVQSHYKALWSKYAQVIDYVNFQFYARDEKASKSQFLKYYHKQSSIYAGSKIIISLLSNGGGLSPKDGFFTACEELREQGKFHGIFMWCADDSKKDGFPYEKKSQDMLASV